MLRHLRRKRSFWAAIALGLLAVPALLQGVGASPANSSDPLPPRDPPLPREPLLPDRAEVVAGMRLAQSEMLADLAPEEFWPIVVAAANRHRVDPRLVAAIISVETEWDPTVVGTSGELGLMQVLPVTGSYLAKKAGLTHYDLADSVTNVNLATGYLAALIDEYGGIAIALAAYNGGPSAAPDWETNMYARKVLKFYETRTLTLARAS
jgi:soluble lytic murein transglycosylase-like protein